MAKYNTDNYNQASPAQQNVTTAFTNATSCIIEIGAVATVQVCRGRILDMRFGIDGIPASTDSSLVWAAQDMTATGTGQASTPVKVNKADAPARSLTKINDTALPTLTAQSFPWSFPLNQHNSYRFYAYDPEAAIQWAATAGTGIGLLVKASTGGYASTVHWSVQFEEF